MNIRFILIGTIYIFYDRYLVGLPARSMIIIIMNVKSFRFGRRLSFSNSHLHSDLTFYDLTVIFIIIMIIYSCRFGRRLSFLIAIFTVISASIIAIFSPNYIFFLVVRFIWSAGSTATYLGAFVLCKFC